MRIAILGDLHFGKHKDSVHLLNYQKKFFEDVFFPTLKKEKIKTIIQLGDVFDKRKQINFYTLTQAKSMFFDELEKRKIKMYTLIGNHDTFFRSTVSLNSIQELLYGYSCVVPIEKPTYIKELNADLLPWIATENEENILSHIELSVAERCFGHLAVTNAMISPGVYSTSGISYEIFSKYKKVFSGHYHIQSFYHNIHYIGTPYQLTFIDVNEEKGFFIWDSENEESLKFVSNPNKMYIKQTISSDSDFSANDFNGKYVKLILSESMTNAQLEKICLQISESNPIDIVIQDFVKKEDDSKETNDESEEGKNSLDMIFDYLQENSQDYEMDKVKVILYELYQESLLENEE